MSPSITRQELLGRLDNARNLEEAGIALYTKHLSNTLFFSGFSPSKRQRMQDILAELASESRMHEQTLKRVIDFVNSSDTDVYRKQL